MPRALILGREKQRRISGGEHQRRQVARHLPIPPPTPLAKSPPIVRPRRHHSSRHRQAACEPSPGCHFPPPLPLPLFVRLRDVWCLEAQTARDLVTKVPGVQVLPPHSLTHSLPPSLGLVASPSEAAVLAFQVRGARSATMGGSSTAMEVLAQGPRTLGRYIAARLVEVGVRDVFTVPGDFNLILLDHLLAEPGLELIGCCNELNAGYAADGYARANGVAACAVTFTVGGLSVINAIAGAYSENLPVICIVGGPNSNDYGTNRILHHTTGDPDFGQELRCFQQVTCLQVVIQSLDNAHELVDRAISAAIAHSKPVYISVSCNLPAIPHPSFRAIPLPYFLTQGPNPRKFYGIGKLTTNKLSLEAAVEAVSELLNGSVKPVLIAGPKLRVAKACDAFEELATASGYAVAAMPSAKGFFPETHPNFIGTYWGAVSSTYTAEIVESADRYLFAGPVFNDYSSVGYSLLIKKENMISLQFDRVEIGNGPSFSCVLMKDFMEALTKKLKKNTASFDNFSRMYVPASLPLKQKPGEPLRTVNLFKHIQGMLTENTALIAETGDSWFNCQKLKLPEGCTYEFQMQYGSIGWAVGATLGYAQGTNKERRVIACIGDGSFQVTAQDVSTMIRNRQKTIIFLLNNGGYTIEVEIHDGPYNIIKNWNYTALVEAFANGEGDLWTCKVRTEEELEQAIATTHEKTDCLCFIEVILHKDDTSKELLEWGSRVANANSRPPNPQ